MSGATTRSFDRLPHTNRQLTRGIIGLLVGGLVAGLTIVVIWVMNAPVWFNMVLGALVLVSGALAVLAPTWYLFIQPVFRGDAVSRE